MEKKPTPKEKAEKVVEYLIRLRNSPLLTYHEKAFIDHVLKADRKETDEHKDVLLQNCMHGDEKYTPS